jgi:hypothetical protein
MNHFAMTHHSINKIYRRGIPVLILLAFAGYASAQDSTYMMTVKEAVEYASKNSYQVRNALIGIDLQRQQNREITAAAYPQLSGSANAGYFPNVAVQTFPNFIAAGTYGVLEKEGVKAGNGDLLFRQQISELLRHSSEQSIIPLQVSIFRNYCLTDRFLLACKLVKTAMQFASKTADVTKEQIKANVYKIYYLLLAGKQQIGTIDANIARFEKLLDDTKKFTKMDLPRN